MFTGIITDTAAILDIKKNHNTCAVRIETHYKDLQLGESITVDGICLTIIDFEPRRSKTNQFGCEISKETLKVTTADQFTPKKPVNLERALTLNDRLGGHIVTGHIDQTLEVADIVEYQPYREITFGKVDSKHKSYLIPKGSVAINGVSLTVNAVKKDSFTVMLIPHTLLHTNLIHLKTKDRVNIEYDSIAKIIAYQIQAWQALQ